MDSRLQQAEKRVVHLGFAPFSRVRNFAPLLLVFLMLSSTWPIAPLPNLEPIGEKNSTEHSSLVDYDLFIADKNTTAGGDGFITTERPDSGGQKDASALEGIEFRSAEMVSNLQIYGKGSASEIRMYYYMQFTGQEGSTADVTISLESGGFQIADKTISLEDPCSSGIFQSSCAYNGRELYFDNIAENGFEVAAGKKLVIRFDASATCESGDGGNPIGGSTCDVRVAFGDVDNDGGSGFTRVEVRANAMKNSEVRVHNLNGSWNDAEVLDWYPNHAINSRTMQFSIDVRNSFGRYDIQQVELVMTSPGGSSYPFEKIFAENELKLDNEGLVGIYNWTYNAGIAPGEYELDLQISDLQGHSVSFEHVGIEMLEVGVSVALGYSQSETVLVAPGKTSSVEFVLDHIGSAGIHMDVELALQQNLGSGWLAVFDQPVYALTGGGSFAKPILSISAPEDDMTNTPDTITIIARAYADQNGDGTEEEVQVVTIALEVEEVGVFSPPRINLFEDVEHQKEIADSTRPDSFDDTISHFVDASSVGRFWLDIVNSGFDKDEFRIKVKEVPELWDVAVYDNITSAELEKQQAAWQTPIIQSHSVDNFFLEVYPPPEREGEDLGIIEIEILSAGDSELTSTVRFTVHRTFGIYAEVIFDPYGLPDGHIGPFKAGAEIDMTVKISAQAGNSSKVTPWQIRNPSSLDKNLDLADGMYGRWDWSITYAANGTFAPKVDLSANSSEEINLNVVTKSGLTAGNHTIFLRVIEEGGGEDARYFDLPLTFEIAQDDPNDLQITQKSELTPFTAGESREMSFKVYNGNNIDLSILVSVSADSGWVVNIERSPLMEISAFSEGNFTVTVKAPDSVRHGDDYTYSIEVRPVDSVIHFGEDYTVRKNVNIEVEAVGIDRIMAEISNPRMPTIVAFVAVVFLLGFGLSRRNKPVVYEEWDEEEEEEDVWDKDDVIINIPAPVIDDDLELLDDELNFDDEDN